MKTSPINHYEQAFENWLIDHRIRYSAIDEHKRAVFSQSKVKSFDFLLYPSNHKVVIAEVKGRKFKGTSFATLSGFECWVTAGDVKGLSTWQRIFGPDHIATFVFAYQIENVDVDFDGREVYEFHSKRYVFFAVKLDDYCSFMKTRSPKWQTVTLSAENFRQYAVPMQNYCC